MENAKPAILFVNYTPYGGGDTVIVSRLASYLAGQGYRIGIVTPENQWLRGQKDLDGASIITIPPAQVDSFRSITGYGKYFFSLVKSTLRIRAIIKKGKWDIIHVNTLPNLAGAFGAWMTRKPLVWHVHELVIQSRIGFSLLRGLPFNLASAILCPSKAVQANFAGPKTTVIPNVIPDKWINSTDVLPDIRSQHRIPSTAKVLLWIGGVAPRKGLSCFLDALQMAGNRTDIVALIVAEPSKKYHDLYLAMKDKIQNSAIRAILVERSPDPRPFYKASDIVFQTSLMPEAFGLTVLEAMAFGKPVVCTGRGGMDDFVRHGDNAHVVEAGKPEALVSAINYLIDNQDYSRKISSQALLTAERYSASRILPLLEQVYAGVLKTGKRSND